MKVKLFGSLRACADGSPSVALKIEGQVSALEIINKLNIPEQSVYVIEKNGQMVDKRSIINDEDELTLLPVIAGG